MGDPERMQVLPARLARLSWFMRCLAEPIARRAYREDPCKGRFWEGRFKSQRLCDERALLAAMTHVDLNPMLVGAADTLQESHHTSAKRRLDALADNSTAALAALGPILGVERSSLAIRAVHSMQRLDWTGRQLVPGKRGNIAGAVPACLAGLDTDAARWLARVRGIRSGYRRAAGSVQDSMALAKGMGRRWLEGVGSAAGTGMNHPRSCCAREDK